MNTVGSDLDFLFDSSKKEKKGNNGMNKLDLSLVDETNPIIEIDTERVNLRLGSI